MRWAALMLALAACEPETGVVHDGDTDIVLTAQYAEGDCGPAPGTIDVVWEIPEEARDITVTLCDKEHASDTGGEQCATRRAEDMFGNTPAEPAIGADGYLRFRCGGYYPTTWRIDYTAPRQ